MQFVINIGLKRKSPSRDIKKKEEKTKKLNNKMKYTLNTLLLHTFELNLKSIPLKVHYKSTPTCT